MIKDKYLNEDILKRAGFLPAEVQYLYTLNDSFPDMEHSYHSDPRIKELFGPYLDRYIQSIENYIESRVSGLAKDISDDQRIILKAPGETSTPVEFFRAMEHIRIGLNTDIKTVLTQTKNINPPLFYVQGDDIQSSELSTKVLSYFQGSTQSVLLNPTVKYKYAYSDLTWADIRRSMPRPKYSSETNNKISDAKSAREVCLKYGLAHINFPNNFSETDRHQYLTQFTDVADRICEKMHFQDPSMFGQAGELGIRFGHYTDECYKGQYNHIEHNICVLISDEDTVAHEYGHAFDRFLGRTFYNNSNGAVQYGGYGSDNIFHNSRNEAVTEPFETLYKVIDPGLHGHTMQESLKPISVKTKKRNLFDSIKNRDFLGAISSLRDLNTGGVYWNQCVEKFARSFSAYITGDVKGYRASGEYHLFTPFGLMEAGVQALTPVRAEKHNKAFDSFFSEVAPHISGVLEARYMSWVKHFNTAQGPQLEAGITPVVPPPMPMDYLKEPYRVTPPPLPPSLSVSPPGPELSI